VDKGLGVGVLGYGSRAVIVAHVAILNNECSVVNAVEIDIYKNENPRKDMLKGRITELIDRDQSEGSCDREEKEVYCHRKRSIL
jgi:hypothetical protein